VTDRRTDTRQQQKERGKNRYISPNCPEARRIGRDVGCDEFFGDRLTGVDFVGGGEFCHFPLTSPVAVNTRLVLPRSLYFNCGVL